MTRGTDIEYDENRWYGCRCRHCLRNPGSGMTELSTLRGSAAQSARSTEPVKPSTGVMARSDAALVIECESLAELKALAEAVALARTAGAKCMAAGCMARSSGTSTEGGAWNVNELLANGLTLDVRPDPLEMSDAEAERELDVAIKELAQGIVAEQRGVTR